MDGKYHEIQDFENIFWEVVFNKNHEITKLYSRDHVYHNVANLVSYAVYKIRTNRATYGQAIKKDHSDKSNKRSFDEPIQKARRGKTTPTNNNKRARPMWWSSEYI